MRLAVLFSGDFLRRFMCSLIELYREKAQVKPHSEVPDPKTHHYFEV